MTRKVLPRPSNEDNFFGMFIPESFDRSAPLYRVFDMTEEGGGARDWYTVEIDNRPGRALGAAEVAVLEEYIAANGWCIEFEAAFDKNKKATVYSEL